MSKIQNDGKRNENDDMKEIDAYSEICQIYSRSDNNWHCGKIVGIFNDRITHKRWFIVSYKNNTKTKKIQKFSKHLRLFDTMMTSNNLLSPLTTHNSQRKELFLSGYLKTHTIKRIPFDVERILDKLIGNDIWYTLGICKVLNINISDDSFVEFSSIQNPKSMSNVYLFKMSYGVNIECKIYPDGKHSKQRGNVMFSFRSTTNIHNIDKVTYYVSIQCVEMNFEWKQIAINEIDVDNSLFTQQCKNKDRLTFNIYVEIINVRYVNIRNFQLFYEDQHFIEPFQMNSCIQYEWIIDENLLKVFRNYNKNQYHFSPNFERCCLSLYCIPKKSKKSTSNSFGFGLNIYRIPHDVGYFIANITFIVYVEFTDNNYKIIEKQVNHYKMAIGANVEQESCKLCSQIIDICQKITIMLKIDIIDSC